MLMSCHICRQLYDVSFAKIEDELYLKVFKGTLILKSSFTIAYAKTPFDQSTTHKANKRLNLLASKLNLHNSSAHKL